MENWTDTSLKAGRLSLKFSDGMLRCICLDQAEAVRGVYFALRDKNWNTIAEELVSLELEAGEDSFSIQYETRYRDPTEQIDFKVKGQITGSDNSVVRWHLEGTALSAFKRNRIGFCVLHPASAAGAPCRVVHQDGSSEKSVFPALIAPHQPFKDLKSLTYGGVKSEFEGDVFEMEDQRNWTDASFKTYCTPLGLPFPVEIARGERITQTITFSVSDDAGLPSRSAAANHSDRCRLSKILPEGHPLADLGWVYVQKLSDSELELVKNLPAGHLRLDIRPDTSPEFIAAAAADAAKAGQALIPFLHLDNDTPDQIYLDAIGAVNFNKTALVGQKELKIVPPERIGPLAAALRSKVRGIDVAAGTDAFFTELNRNRLDARTIDRFVFSMNPQVHAFDNLSLVETLEGQVANVQTAMDLSGGQPPWCSPVTLKMRWNPNATGEQAVEDGVLPADVDPRQMSPLCACWTLASIGLISRAGAELVTYYELSGWKGLFESEAGSADPDRFPSMPLQRFPVFDVFALLKGFEGGTVYFRESNRPLAACSYRVSQGAKILDILINLSETAGRFEVDDNPFSREASVLYDWKDAETSGRDLPSAGNFSIGGNEVRMPGYSVLICAGRTNG